MATESKLVTLDNLQDAVTRILELLGTKADIDGEPRFTGVKLLYGEDSCFKLMMDDTSDPPEILVVTNGEPKTLAMNFSDKIFTKRIDTDEITTSDWSEADSETYYCMPTSSVEAKTKATTAANGGGTVLTTKYRNYEYSIRTLTAGMSLTIEPFVYSKINISTGGSVAISLDKFNSGAVNEYWIELNIGNDFGSVPNQNGSPVMFYDNANIRWAGGEPGWATLRNKTVQIHIVNKIASYVIINNA